MKFDSRYKRVKSIPDWMTKILVLDVVKRKTIKSLLGKGAPWRKRPLTTHSWLWDEAKLIASYDTPSCIIHCLTTSKLFHLLDATFPFCDGHFVSLQQEWSLIELGDKNGKSKCKSPHSSQAAFPSDWLPAVEPMAKGIKWRKMTGKSDIKLPTGSFKAS